MLALHPWNNTLKIRTKEAIMYVLESTDREFKENMFKQGKLVE